MARAEPYRRVRIDEELCLRLEKRLQDAGRRDDLSPYVEEICNHVLSGRAIVLSEEMVSRLQNVKQELKRKEELSPFVEWICELFLERSGENQETGGIVIGAGFEKDKSEQRKTG